MVNIHLLVVSEVICSPTLVGVQVRLDDRSQLVVVAVKLLRVHQQVASEVWLVLRAAPH